MPEVTLRAADEGVAMLGAVLSYGALVAPLQRAFLGRCAASRRGCRCAWARRWRRSRTRVDEVEVDAGIAERSTSP